MPWIVPYGGAGLVLRLASSAVRSVADMPGVRSFLKISARLHTASSSRAGLEQYHAIGSCESLSAVPIWGPRSPSRRAGGPRRRAWLVVGEPGGLGGNDANAGLRAGLLGRVRTLLLLLI